ncbi:MAG: hypothetical protein U0229_15830 [Anaeromyxobacter sp.]
MSGVSGGRGPLLALAGIGALLVAGIGVVLWATRPVGSAPGQPTPAVAPAADVPPPIVLAPTGPAVFPSQRTEPPPPPVIMDVAPPPPPPGSWEAVTPVGRLSALGPLGGAVGRALAERRDALAACFDLDVQSRHGAAVPTVAGDATGEEGGASPTVMLQLETGSGVVRIVDATVDVRAGAADGLFSCTQRVLRGMTADAPQARPGKRFRVPYTLTP